MTLLIITLAQDPLLMPLHPVQHTTPTHVDPLSYLSIINYLIQNKSGVIRLTYLGQDHRCTSRQSRQQTFGGVVGVAPQRLILMEQRGLVSYKFKDGNGAVG